MRDDKYIIMRQCIRDAKELYHNSFYTRDNIYSWNDFSTFTSAIATALFAERSKNPITPKNFQKLLLGAESASQELEEIKKRTTELNDLFIRIEKQNEELKKLKDMARTYRAQNFLSATVGKANFEAFKKTGYIDIIKGESFYRLYEDGTVRKYRLQKSWSPIGQSKYQREWSGRIAGTGGLPLSDAIAIIYARILDDHVAFDEEKGCGKISIRGV